jgi:mannosyltransferase OCH1-like enzyme
MTDELNRKFIIDYFPSFLPYYDAFPYPIQRADAIRYA